MIGPRYGLTQTDPPRNERDRALRLVGQAIIAHATGRLGSALLDRTMTPLPPRGRGRTTRRPESSDLAGAQGRGAAVPRMDPGRDTLLGLARSTRRTLAWAGFAAQNTSGVGAYAETAFILNGPFNVLGGSSANGYAKYMAFYSKCFVLGARIRIRAVVINNATTAALMTTLAVTTNSTSLGTSPPAVMNGMCDWMVAFNLPDRILLDQAVDVGRFLNKPRVLDDPQLFCTAAANPTQVVVAHYGVQAAAATAASINTQYLAEVTFDCVFTDPIPFT